MPGGAGYTVTPGDLRKYAKEWEDFSEIYDKQKTEAADGELNKGDFPFEAERIHDGFMKMNGWVESFLKDGGTEFQNIATKLIEAADKYDEAEEQNSEEASKASPDSSGTPAPKPGSGPVPTMEV